MKHLLIFLTLNLSFFMIAQKLNYPTTKKENIKDNYFGTVVKDPYRWLEDDLAQNTKNWVESQNKLTFDYLNKIPFRDKLRKELQEMYNYEKISAPFKKGKYTYFYKNNGLQQHPVLYQQEGTHEPKVFLDPNTFSKDGSISLAGVSFSKNGEKMAYQISEGGSDWRKIIVIEVESKKAIEDTLKDVKFSDIAWLGTEGFFYSSYDKPQGSQLSAQTTTHKLYYHKIGTQQTEDKLIFGKEINRRYVGAGVSEDEKFLFISAAQSTYGNELYYINLQDKNMEKITPIVTGFENDHNVIDNDGDLIYLATDYKAPNNRLVKFNIQKPSQENWIDVIAEKEHVLSVSSAGKNFFGIYTIDALENIIQFNREGSIIRKIELPSKGSVSGFMGMQADTEIYYTFTNAIYPATIFKYDIATGKSELYKKPNVKFDSENYISEQVFYFSKDGTKVPMMITYHKNTKLNGKNPTILYGYGGFNISLSPNFGVYAATFMKNGGIYAVANLRGGGEYGKKWHDAGTKQQKKNVFNDFIAAAEYLYTQGYTSKDYLAISGGSNGGLLVGATMTMRPDICKVAVPAVGVLDMLRYHQFTAGKGWAYDYGTADDSQEMFEYLKSYSPVHNVKPNTCYPATLITTGDHDDRVVPAHSYKFAVELQKKQSCNKNPTLIRIETKAGHGAGKSTEVLLDEWADVMSFIFWNMGYKTLPNMLVPKK